MARRAIPGAGCSCLVYGEQECCIGIEDRVVYFLGLGGERRNFVAVVEIPDFRGGVRPSQHSSAHGRHDRRSSREHSTRAGRIDLPDTHGAIRASGGGPLAIVAHSDVGQRPRLAYHFVQRPAGMSLPETTRVIVAGRRCDCSARRDGDRVQRSIVRYQPNCWTNAVLRVIR